MERADCCHLAMLLHTSRQEQPNHCCLGFSSNESGRCPPVCRHTEQCARCCHWRDCIFDEHCIERTGLLQPVIGIGRNKNSCTGRHSFSVFCNPAPQTQRKLSCAQARVEDLLQHARPGSCNRRCAPVPRGGQQSFLETLWAQAFSMFLPLAHAGRPSSSHSVLSAGPSVHVWPRSQT